MNAKQDNKSHYAWKILAVCCMIQGGVVGTIQNSCGVFYQPVCQDFRFHFIYQSSRACRLSDDSGGSAPSATFRAAGSTEWGCVGVFSGKFPDGDIFPDLAVVCRRHRPGDCLVVFGVCYHPSSAGQVVLQKIGSGNWPFFSFQRDVWNCGKSIWQLGDRDLGLAKRLLYSVGSVFCSGVSFYSPGGAQISSGSRS